LDPTFKNLESLSDAFCVFVLFAKKNVAEQHMPGGIHGSHVKSRTVAWRGFCSRLLWGHAVKSSQQSRGKYAKKSRKED